MNKNKLILPISIIVGCIILGGFYYASQNNKNNSFIKDGKLIKDNINNLSAEKASSLVNLYYNQSTGELYPILPNGVSPHTCVWTIWGDHGSETTLVTKNSFIDKNTDPIIESNKFLPPRVPIYVTCVDWENNNYHGVIGENK